MGFMNCLFASVGKLVGGSSDADFSERLPKIKQIVTLADADMDAKMKAAAEWLACKAMDEDERAKVIKAGDGSVAGFRLPAKVNFWDVKEFIKFFLVSEEGLSEDDSLAAYIDIGFENFRRVDAAGNNKVYYMMLGGNLAPGEKVRKPGDMKWEKGIYNPHVGEVKIQDESGFLSYICPTCGVIVSIEQSSIGESGVKVLCGTCGSFSHVGAGFSDKKPKKKMLQPIYSSVSVPIEDFSDWYLSHPVFKELVNLKKGECLNHYGLWAICPECKLEYISTVLNEFPMFQMSAGGIFNARSEGSANQMESLVNYKCCPECPCSSMLAIMSEIPVHIQKRIDKFNKSNG